MHIKVLETGVLIIPRSRIQGTPYILRDLGALVLLPDGARNHAGKSDTRNEHRLEPWVASCWSFHQGASVFQE